MKNLICIGCPKGCHLTVDEENDYRVTGNGCQIGADYGRSEIMDPRRVLTSTVKISGAPYRRCPVRTSSAVPKPMLFDVMSEINKAQIVSPVKRGDIVISNVLGTGADVIVTKDM